MKNILIFVLFIATHSLYAQHPGNKIATDTNKVSFVCKFDEAKMARKDGYAMNDYLVNISYQDAKKLDGKTIRITGQYTLVKGLESQVNESERENQGRLNDIRHIESPNIEILD